MKSQCCSAVSAALLVLAVRLLQEWVMQIDESTSGQFSSAGTQLMGDCWQARSKHASIPGLS